MPSPVQRTMRRAPRRRCGRPARPRPATAPARDGDRRRDGRRVGGRRHRARRRDEARAREPRRHLARGRLPTMPPAGPCRRPRAPPTAQQQSSSGDDGESRSSGDDGQAPQSSPPASAPQPQPAARPTPGDLGRLVSATWSTTAFPALGTTAVVVVAGTGDRREAVAPARAPSSTPSTARAAASAPTPSWHGPTRRPDGSCASAGCSRPRSAWRCGPPSGPAAPSTRPSSRRWSRSATTATSRRCAPTRRRRPRPSRRPAGGP